MVLLVIIWTIVVALIVGFGVYKHYEPQLTATAQINTNIQQQNQQLSAQNKILIDNNNNLKSEQIQLQQQKTSTLENIQDLSQSLKSMEQQAQDAADAYQKSKMEIAENNLNNYLKKCEIKFEDAVRQFAEISQARTLTMEEAIKNLEENLACLRATNDAAVAAAKRAEEIKTEKDFYRICLSDVDVNEIELLRSVEPHLRNKEPLNKVIWKCYYEKPTTDMIGRVVGSGVHTGIYKITEIATGKCYVGQAANIADRWKQHIKRGVGADTPTRNKLYPAMITAGPENFTFEVVEECDRAALDAREDYWQDYFKAKEFGYSIK